MRSRSVQEMKKATQRFAKQQQQRSIYMYALHYVNSTSSAVDAIDTKHATGPESGAAGRAAEDPGTGRK